MPTKAELGIKIKILEDTIRLLNDGANRNPSQETVIRLKLDPIQLIQSNADFQAGQKNILLSKMCPACQAAQVHVRHNDGRMKFTCPACDYDWTENAAYNEKGSD